MAEKRGFVKKPKQCFNNKQYTICLQAITSLRDQHYYLKSLLTIISPLTFLPVPCPGIWPQDELRKLHSEAPRCIVVVPDSHDASFSAQHPVVPHSLLLVAAWTTLLPIIKEMKLL